MEKQLDEIIEHVSHSQEQMARILEAQRHTSNHMADIIHDMPDNLAEMNSDSVETSENHVEQVNSSITSYLNVMADFQQFAADSLELVLKELRNSEESEE